MTPAQKATLKLSEKREALARFSGPENEVEALRNEIADLEKEYRTALEAEETVVETATPESRELAALIATASVGDLLSGVIEQRASSGAMAELQQHHGLNMNQLPIELLAIREPEERAVTPGATNVEGNQQAIEPYVFPQGAAAYLSIPTPTVPVGDAVYPVTTAELDVHTPAESASAAETTGAFSSDVLTPARLQSSFFFSVEDRARFAGMEEALRSNLSAGLSAGLDKQIVAGTNGLLTGTNLSNNNVSAITTFEKYISDLALSRVDGRYAATAGDVRVVMGSDSYGHAGSVYRNTSVDRTALDRLMELTGGVRVSAHVPDLSSSNKQNAIVRLGSRRDMVAPIWQGITMIPDNITKAGTGQIVLTAVMLHAVKILRAGGWHKQQLQTA